MADELVRLCRCDTTTGSEDAGESALLSVLEPLRPRIERQAVAPGRTNILATWGDPKLLFTTHLDTVPPYIPPRVEGGRVFGRGTCDAKGQIVAHLETIRTLLESGHRDLAFLGVVGEETDSIGAQRAKELAPKLRNLRAVIDGEPTENKVATGQRGILHVRLECRGKAAHSGTPERGKSAIWPLLDWLQELKRAPRPLDPDLGPEIWNLARIRGGSAPNVVPDHATADILVRSLPDSDFMDCARRLAPAEGAVERVHETLPDRFPAIAGFERALVPFGSDAPRLRSLAKDGTVVLVGPGSIELAHSVDERIDLFDLERGVSLLTRLAVKLMDNA